jgi:hypothetical protein
MKRYNVEIFNRSFVMVSHTTVSNPAYAVDYLTHANNELLVLNCLAHKGDYIRIQGDGNDFFGVITAIARQDSKTMIIQYSDFLTLFDTDILFDTDLQGTSTLEQVMANLITGMFISNADSRQNVTGLSVETVSNTTGWGFNLKSDTEGKHHCIINFYNSIIVRALEKYSVVITVTPDIQNKAIVLSIGKVYDTTKVIEADLPNIAEKNIIIKETDKDVNKLTVYNSADYVTNRIYYKHSDGTYNTTNADRVVPVVAEIKAVDVQEGQTFASVADSEAVNVFGASQYNNLIELTVLNDDTLVQPYALDIGQIVSVISGGTVYNTILTGKAVSDRTLLTFGTIRLDLTKIIKRRYG